jgi:hypothetical protein
MDIEEHLSSKKQALKRVGELACTAASAKAQLEGGVDSSVALTLGTGKVLPWPKMRGNPIVFYLACFAAVEQHHQPEGFMLGERKVSTC